MYSPGGGGGGLRSVIASSPSADVDGDDAGAAFHPRTAVDDLTDEFREKVSVPGALTKPPVKAKQKVYLYEDCSLEEILCWLAVKGFSCRSANSSFVVVEFSAS